MALHVRACKHCVFAVFAPSNCSVPLQFPVSSASTGTSVARTLPERWLDSLTGVLLACHMLATRARREVALQFSRAGCCALVLHVCNC